MKVVATAYPSFFLFHQGTYFPSLFNKITLINILNMDWRDCCSSKRPKFTLQHPRQAAMQLLKEVSFKHSLVGKCCLQKDRGKLLILTGRKKWLIRIWMQNNSFTNSYSIKVIERSSTTNLFYCLLMFFMKALKTWMGMTAKTQSTINSIP